VNYRDMNFTRAKMERRMAQIEEPRWLASAGSSRGTAQRLGSDPVKSKLGEVEFLDK
jgi:hypothetical protein